MGTAARALVIAAGAALFAAPGLAHAECSKLDENGSRYPICFDPGNRLSLTASSDGFGGSFAVRHLVHFEDDPDLLWKLEHVAGDVSRTTLEGVEATLYRGRFIRHTRDGHIVMPTSPPRKIFLPFDIGAYVEAGSVRIAEGDMGVAKIGVVKVAPLIDLWRSRDFKRRFAIGPMARWDIGVPRDELAIAKQTVAPFSTAMMNLHVESANGLTVFDAVVEAGTAWSSDRKWQTEIRAEASFERTLIAINDRPIAMLAAVRYESERHETIARAGVRIALFR